MSPTPDARTRILEAAATLFVERGYEGTTLQAIATEAGVAKGLPSHHFRTKQALLNEVLDAYYALHVEVLEQAVSAAEGPRAQVNALLDAYFDFACENSGYPRLVQRVSDQEDVRKIVRTHMQAVLKSVERILVGVCPAKGPTAARHFFLTFSAVIINYVTYAPLVMPTVGKKRRREQQAERRAHILWLGDACLDALAAQEP